MDAEAFKLSLDEKKVLYSKGFADPVWFLNFYLKDWFPDKIPWVHRGILAILTRRTDFLPQYGDLDKIVKYFVWKEDPTDEKSPEHPLFELQSDGSIVLLITPFTLIQMPRGFSKTTLCNGFVVYAICYSLRNFIVYISESGDHAETQLRNVKGVLESNSRLISVYGEFKPAERSGKKWTESLIECLTGTVVKARGRGSQIRGLNEDGDRPDLIIGDDIEDKESVSTEEQRKKTKTWFFGDVIPALPSVGEAKLHAGIVMLGTLLHGDALLANLSKDPEWTTVIFGAMVDGQPLWEAAATEAELARKRASYARNGELNAFYLEYFNKIRNEDSAKFKSHYIVVPSDFEVSRFIHRALTLDPAISGKKAADLCSFAVVGMSAQGRFGVLDHISKKGMHPREQIDTYFMLSKKWQCTKHGIEATAFQQALVHLMREEMFRKKQYFEIEEIRYQTAKVPRVEGILAPRYAAGYITHRVHFPELETALLDWPNGFLDPPDVVAMAIGLLDPYAASAADEGFDLADDEYPSLEDEGLTQFFGAP